MGRSIDERDPFSFMTAPPSNESPEEMAIREKVEAEAKKISEQIDESINQERSALKKKRHIKVLLLGQSESGRAQSTLITLCSQAHFLFRDIRKVNNIKE